MLSGHPELSKARLFIRAFSLALVAGIFSIAVLHVMLARKGLLVPPPYVATWCIDQKLDYLAKADLDTVELAAIGSSGAWRNLDMTVLEESLGVTSINAAPCYLYANQTAYLSEFLLPRMPKLETLLFVALPRDFESCEAKDEAFFDEDQFGLVVDHHLPRWLPYISGFKPMYVANFARARAAGTGDVGAKIRLDGRGSATLDQQMQWSPDLTISEACYPALNRLEALTRSRNIDLVVALAPTDPTWRKEQDPDGTILAAWRSRLRESLSNDVVIIDGQSLNFGPEYFADALHLIHPHQFEFSRYIALSLSAREAGEPAEMSKPPEGL